MADGEIGLGGVTRNREKTKKAIIEQVKKYFKTNNLSFNDYTFTIGTVMIMMKLPNIRNSLKLH